MAANAGQQGHMTPAEPGGTPARGIAGKGRGDVHQAAEVAGPGAAANDGYRGTLPPPLVPPRRGMWTYVERADQLAQVVEGAEASDLLALDAEFIQMRTRRPGDPPHRLALLQLAMSSRPGRAFIVDPLRLPDLSPLEAPLTNPRILKLFHGIDADARVLATRGLAAHHTLDLEAVSRSIFGQRESGLQAMLLRACGVRLDKSLQRSDWSRRPLTPAMLAYAARDAEMTLVLYTWLTTHYPWAIAAHEVAADHPGPRVAAWIRPFLDGARPQRTEWAVASAGLDGNRAVQEGALRAALAEVHRPPQRARVIRMISDLELGNLAPEVRELLNSPAADERATAARTLGRLRDHAAEPALRPLLDDPVQDVREAAQMALDHLANRASPTGSVTRSQRANATSWTAGGAGDDQQAPDGWQAMLRARFGTIERQQNAASSDQAPSPTLKDEAEGGSDA